MLTSLCGPGFTRCARPSTGQNRPRRFHDVEKAKAAGYTVRVADAAGLTTIAQPGQKGDGRPYAQPGLLDGAVVAETPELLVYEQRNDGELKLVALEYLVFQADWKGSSRRRSSGEFDFTGTPNRYGLPAFLAPRMDLEAEPERDPDPVEPAGELLKAGGPGPRGLRHRGLGLQLLAELRRATNCAHPVTPRARRPRRASARAGARPPGVPVTSVPS